VNSLIERAQRIVGGAPSPGSSTTGDRAEQDNKLNALLAEKQGLELKIASRELARKRRAIGGWTSLGLSTVSAGLAGLFYYFGNDAYRDYQSATTIPEAREKQKLVELWDTMTTAALGTSGACLIISSIFWISRPSVRQFTEELNSLEREIELLEAEIR